MVTVIRLAGGTGTPVDWAHIQCLSVAKIRIYDQFLLTLLTLQKIFC